MFSEKARDDNFLIPDNVYALSDIFECCDVYSGVYCAVYWIYGCKIGEGGLEGCLAFIICWLVESMSLCNINVHHLKSFGTNLAGLCDTQNQPPPEWRVRVTPQGCFPNCFTIHPNTSENTEQQKFILQQHMHKIIHIA